MTTPTKRYVLQADTPRFGKAGAVVALTEAQARYMVLSGQLLAEDEHLARQATDRGEPSAVKPARSK